MSLDTMIWITDGLMIVGLFVLFRCMKQLNPSRYPSKLQQRWQARCRSYREDQERMRRIQIIVQTCQLEHEFQMRREGLTS